MVETETMQNTDTLADDTITVLPTNPAGERSALYDELLVRITFVADECADCGRYMLFNNIQMRQGSIPLAKTLDGLRNNTKLLHIYRDEAYEIAEELMRLCMPHNAEMPADIAAQLLRVDATAKFCYYIHRRWAEWMFLDTEYHPAADYPSQMHYDHLHRNPPGLDADGGPIL